MQDSDCRVPASHGSARPWVNVGTRASSPGWTHHQGTLCPHRPSQAVQQSPCLGMGVALSLSLGLAGTELLPPSLWPKASIRSVCCLCFYTHTALPPESCLQPTQAFWVPWLSCASCSLLLCSLLELPLPLAACSRALSTALQQHRGGR